jgi:hypothetical protein
VIGVMVFSENPPVHHYYGNGGLRGVMPNAFPLGAGVFVQGSGQYHYATPTIDGGMLSGSADNTWYGLNSTMVGSSLTASCASERSIERSAPCAPSASSAPSSLRAKRFSPSANARREPQPKALNNLGTGFGHAQEFATETVSFTRGDLLATMIVYYDDARGLKARGIQIGRPSRARYATQPQAFPGMACVPPKGWQG